MTKRAFIFTLFFSLFSVQSCAADTDKSTKNPVVLIQTSMGDIEAELYPEKAPETVKNFLRYVHEGFYNGTIFHRVIPNFMIQGGGFTPDMQKKPTHAPIQNEADNGLRNRIGTLAMARTNDPHSATSQFFINVAQNTFLDFREKTPRAYGYAVFGRVIKGMRVVNQIRQVQTGFKNGMGDVPLQTVEIIKVTQIQ
ncbi:peptidylprolyl isomerase [Thiomicrospira sp. XS5]|uniref:peptidylprolyl isomerase n=1 Tax=Thiomicrospira sp. XS5 TaxID=1775636 RepID=UPI0007475EC6|nr:peptidylprolyl isomerase [Thiomicrospira sp. XS5]KUJ75006.1 peptidylprolyl isomerase [Thiomicrospira sp. XS5]